MVNFDCWRPQHMPTCCLRLMVSYMLGNYCPRSCQQNSNSIIEKQIIFPNVWSSHLNCLILSCEGHCLHVSLYLLITYLNIGVNVTLLNLSQAFYGQRELFANEDIIVPPGGYEVLFPYFGPFFSYMDWRMLVKKCVPRMKAYGLVVILF